METMDIIYKMKEIHSKINPQRKFVPIIPNSNFIEKNVLSSSIRHDDAISIVTKTDSE